MERVGDERDAVPSDEGAGRAGLVDGAAHALEGVDQHEGGRAANGFATRSGAQEFEGRFDESRPGVDEAVAGDGRLDHFFEAMVVVGEGDGAQLGGVRRASTRQERTFCEGALGGLGGGHTGTHVVDHGAQTVNVLGLVATSLAGFALRGAEAVASFPGAQGGGGYSQFIGH